MDLSYSTEYLTFRDEVRQFLTEHWDPKQARDGERGKAYAVEFRRKATARGYLNRSIPKLYGGSEQPADVLRGHIIKEEFARARAVTEVTGIGTMMLVPTLLERGEEWQREMFVERTVTGEIKWAQGYSEPGSGSDLASLKTRAELRGDEWVINGQKIWTTLAQEANYMFALVRTEPGASKHAGISYLLLDFKQPGITVRPLKQISGSSEFCEVFLDDVRTPAHWIVGKRGEGWSVSKSTLKHERSGVGNATGALQMLEKLLELARSHQIDGRPAIEHPLVRERIAALDGYVYSHLYSGFYQLTKHANDESPGIISLINKINSTNIGQDVANIAADIIGEDLLKMPDLNNWRKTGDEKWINQIMGSLGMSIAGGTSNIQRNIISERGLELPRELAD